MTRRYSRVLLAVAPRVLVMLMLVTMLLPGPAARAAAPAPAGPQVASSNLIKDGGFELGTPNPDWSEYLHAANDTRTTPLCDTVCAGENLAHLGNWWALFGGADGPVQAAITQTVTILPLHTSLSFWLWLATSSGLVTDTLSVLVDGHEVWRTDAMTTTYAMTYTQVTVNLDPALYANGQPHRITFNSTTNSPADGFPATFVLDDVSLDTAYHVYLPFVEK